MLDQALLDAAERVRADPPGPASPIGFAGMAFTVSAPDPVVAYASRFQPERPTPAGRGVQIIHVVDDALWHRLSRSRGILDCWESVRTFVGRSARFQDVQVSGQVVRIVVSLPDRAAVVAYRDAAIIIASSQTSARFPMRVMRELILGDAVACLHASAVVEPGGGAVVIVGPSGSGKTSLALALVEESGARLMGNDYLVTSGRIIGALPLRFRVGLGTAMASPLLRTLSRRRSLSLGAGSVGDPDASLPAAEPGSAHKLEFYPDELSDLYGVGVVQRAPCRYLIFPKLISSSDAMEIVAVDQREAVSRLLRARKSAQNSVWPDRWLTPSPLPVDRALMTADKASEVALDGLARQSEVLEWRIPLDDAMPRSVLKCLPWELT